MTMPQWNSEWEKPDPLRNRRGWCRHHYAAIGTAAILLVIAFGVAVPAVCRARQQEAEVDRTYKQLQAAFVVGASDTLRR